MERLANRYLLGKVLGEGSMGAVYEAWDEVDQEWRAVKILHLPISGSRTVRERFRREARVLERLEHPHIVRLRGHGEDDSLIFLVMERVPGGSLLGWIDRHGPMPPALAARVCRQVCRALEEAHGQGVIHRDIKPTNVLIGEDHTCRVVDFGIALLGDEVVRLTRAGVRMGSPGFMAPEQEVSARDVDHRADIYGLGATLYALVTGRTPGHMESAIAEDLPVLAGPVGLVIMRSTLTRPSQRYGSAQEMGVALDRALARLPQDPPDTPPLYRATGVSREPPQRASETLISE